MIQQPLISVCIPVYNGGKYIVQTIESVFRQNYLNLEIIVQDNASSDNTWQLLKSLAQKNSQLSIKRNEQNYGMAANWNMAINRANGDYIMLLCADDFLEDFFLEKCLVAFREHCTDAVTTNHYYLKNGQKTKRRLRLVGAGVYQNFCQSVLLFNPFSINFTLFSRPLINRLCAGGNLFTKSYYTCDYDLWIRLSLTNARVTYLTECLGTYRIHEENLSKQSRRMSRQTALTLFSHKKELRKICRRSYQFTLLRFILRNLKSALRQGVWDLRMFRVLTCELYKSLI